MGDDAKAWHALLLENLEAIVAVREIELAGLNFVIDSLDAPPEERAKAVARREAVTVEWGNAITELESARAGFSRAEL